MTITQEQFAVLAAPFQPDEHEFVNDKIYIKETAVCQRIEEVDIAWQWIEPTIQRYDLKTEIATVSGTLIICGTSRFGVGQQSFALPKRYEKETDAAYLLRIEAEFRKAELEKGSATDCLKRAARLFGIGRYLLQCPKDVKSEGQALNKWLEQVGKAQDWSPQYMEARAFRVLGLVREDIMGIAKAVPNWSKHTYQEKFFILEEEVNRRNQPVAS